ncbi:interleukin-1 receptor-associated kinase 1-binding protein 1 homolog [Mugil cephalus]|uniref:interleukin-1 receptor-associated kinase 1-binding protein 1 homolog n=1 Tax=Mugil cephalus TaxID=48193 RepID=UPI001FB64F19|nr:interleukin-1 receptor-associated kinase 1-binding protein 1 homolog [Mugil cephalus]
MMDSPSRVFAAILPAAGRELAGDEKEQGLEVRTVTRDGPGSRGRREVRVTGRAEVCCPADRASMRICVGYSKESVNEVTNSVSRRLEYILQALRHNGIGDGDTSVRRFLHRDEALYRLDVEVVVTFSDFEKMEQVCRILLEKLDKSVSVGTPQFYHSAECLGQTRQRACVSAVDNAHQKASKVCQLLGQSLGSPLLVKEEETKEWRNEEEEEEDGGGGQGPAPPPHFPHIPTITASSQVSVSFSLRDRSRKNL